MLVPLVAVELVAYHQLFGSENVTFARLLQKAKALLLILVTPEPIITSVRL